MAYAMTKQGSLDNCITYEFICDTVADMNAIENRYRTIGTVAIVLSGESEGLEVYIAGSDKQWNNIGTMGASGDTGTAGLSIYICAQNEVSNGVPNIQDPDETTVYLVAADETSGNLYEEYIYVNNAWERFGAANIDLSGYATIADPVFTGSISDGRKANTTIGTNSFTIGVDTTASGDFSQALGYSTTATGTAAHAEGMGGSVMFDNVTYQSGAIGTADHVEGYQCLTANGMPGNHAEGYLTRATGGGAHAEGCMTVASGQNSHAEGNNTVAQGVQSHAEGSDTKAVGTYSHAEGQGGTYTDNGTSYESKAAGNADHVEGCLCLTGSAGEPGKHAEGNKTRATGGAAHSEGISTLASGLSSHAEGWTTVASGNYSHAEGNLTIASEAYTHAEGYSTNASGPFSHTEGSDTVASGAFSHAEGSHSTASGSYAHAQGCYTTASGQYSHAEGNNSLASGYYAHAQGQYTIASGECSHAEGYNMTAAGRNSHVFGRYNVVDTNQTFEEWEPNKSYFLYDKVKRTANNTVKSYICKIMNADASFTESNWYDITGEQKYIEIVGNGITGNASNARALDWDGNERLKGDLYVGCNSDSTGGVKIARIPDPPTTDGTYTLQATVASGIVTYTWIAGV